jgi:hypothetical protein
MSKIAEKFNFKYVRDFNVDKIIDIANLNKDVWFFEEPDVKVYSKYYAVYESSIHWKPESEPFVVTQESNDEQLLSLLEPIISHLEMLCDGVRAEVIITNLRGYNKIDLHMDHGPYLSKVRRHHVPLITSELVDFCVGSDKVNMKVGECWEINNNRPHSVQNNGNEDRIHVIIDIMPKIEMGNI